MDYENKHTNEFKKAFSTMSKIRKEIAWANEYEADRFDNFLPGIRLGDRIRWVELDGREYEGTAVAYLNGGTPNHGVRIAVKYGNIDLTVDKASTITKAWKKLL